MVCKFLRVFVLTLFNFWSKVITVFSELLAIAEAGSLGCLAFTGGYFILYAITYLWIPSWSILRKFYEVQNAETFPFQELPKTLRRRFIETMFTGNLRTFRKSNKEIFYLCRQLRGTPVDELVLALDSDCGALVTEIKGPETMVGLSFNVLNEASEKWLKSIVGVKRLGIGQVDRLCAEATWKLMNRLPSLNLDCLFIDVKMGDLRFLRNMIRKFESKSLYCRLTISTLQFVTINEILGILNDCKSEAITFEVNGRGNIQTALNDINLLIEFCQNHPSFNEVTLYFKEEPGNLWRQFWKRSQEFGVREINQDPKFNSSRWIAIP